MSSLHLLEFSANRNGEIEIRDGNGNMFRISFTPQGATRVIKPPQKGKPEELTVIHCSSNQIFII